MKTKEEKKLRIKSIEPIEGTPIDYWREATKGIKIPTFDEEKTKVEIEKILIDIAIKVVKNGKGCILILKEKNFDYDLLVEQDIKPFDINLNLRRSQLLSEHDGAVIVDLNGNLINYAVHIKTDTKKSFMGFGTRHLSSHVASLPGNTVVLGSEEDRKVRIFKHGKIIMEIDPFAKNIEYKTKEAVNILESVGIGSVMAVGATVIVPTLGIAIIPGIIVFGSTHFLIKYLMGKK